MEEKVEERVGGLSDRGQNAPPERRSSKVVKKSREKKQLSDTNITAVLEAAENYSPGSEDIQDGKERRQSGVVIDGKTYTCAACKTGHRVGVCKHGKERPMTATHPPGRPSVGAPKKVICNCPKQCNCRKRDCKCARKCSCTQLMYMLVHIPAPGAAGSSDEEQGTWRKSHPVITDLKGNILTQEEVRQRQEQKESQKAYGMEPKAAGGRTKATTEPSKPALPEHEAKPKEGGGCCTHKDEVAAKNIITETTPQSGRLTQNATSGCNCGGTCTCAFCPEHPNNSTSTNMARQQAMYFANRPYSNDQQSIVSFAPTVPQGASCMGGLPRFAVSRYSQRPSYEDLQQAFPNPGYVIGYPFWSTRTDDAGYSVPPFPMQPPFTPSMDGIDSGGLHGTQNLLHTPHPELQHPDFSQEEFGIGSAFVTSAGPADWGQDFLTPGMWTMDSAVPTPLVNNMVDMPNFPSQSAIQSLPSTPMEGSGGYRLPGLPSENDEGTLFRTSGPSSLPNINITDQQIQPHGGCCDAPQTSSAAYYAHMPTPYFPPVPKTESPPTSSSQGQNKVSKTA